MLSKEEVVDAAAEDAEEDAIEAEAVAGEEEMEVEVSLSVRWERRWMRWLHGQHGCTYAKPGRHAANTPASLLPAQVEEYVEGDEEDEEESEDEDEVRPLVHTLLCVGWRCHLVCGKGNEDGKEEDNEDEVRPWWWRQRWGLRWG